jgi:hypothetical protein
VNKNQRTARRRWKSAGGLWGGIVVT